MSPCAITLCMSSFIPACLIFQMDAFVSLSLQYYILESIYAFITKLGQSFSSFPVWHSTPPFIHVSVPCSLSFTPSPLCSLLSLCACVGVGSVLCGCRHQRLRLYDPIILLLISFVPLLYTAALISSVCFRQERWGH